VEADLDDELRFHIDMRIRDYKARGMSEAEARVATARRLGDLALSRQACLTIDHRMQRQIARASVLDALAQDARYAFRTLGRQTGWTVVAVLTLSLGIGANTAMFSIVDTLLLRPLPYPDAGRIAIVYQEPVDGNTQGMRVMVTPPPPVVRAWREGTRTFESIEPYHTLQVAYLPRAGTAEVLHAAAILPGFLRFAGQSPLVGRAFTDAEVRGRSRVALVSESFWRLRAGSDPTIVGRSLSLDGSPYLVVGVMPATFRMPAVTQISTDVWLPLDLQQNTIGLQIVARFARGVEARMALRELDSLAAQSGVGTATAQFRTRLMMPSELVSFHDSLVLLAAAVSLVLLIACANVAHLLLARAASRQRELAIRAALGAGQGRIVRQLLTESLVLAAAGCVGGLIVGRLALAALLAVRPEQFAELSVARMNITTLVVTIVASLVTGIAFGLVGAWQTARRATHEALKVGALSTSHSRAQQRLRSLLVVSEIAVSTTLLVGAALLIRSVIHLQSRDPGFVPDGLFAMEIALPEATYHTPAARIAFFTELSDRSRLAPGVTAVSVAASTPPSRSLMIGSLQIEGDPTPPASATSFIDFNGVEPGFFKLMGIPILQGTTFTDTTEAAHQVIVNQGLAKRYWKGASPIGRRLRVVYNGQGDWHTIVGVAGNAFTSGYTAEASTPLLYVPTGPHPSTLLVRTTGTSRTMPALRALVAAIDPRLPPPNVSNVAAAMSETIAGPRFTMLLLTMFTGLALLLAAVGLYGVMAYSVAQRTREIGIRVALGATRRQIARAVVRQGLVLAAGGVVVGLVAAHWATQLVQNMLYGVARSDLLSFFVGALVLIATALLACLVPMRRAVAVDPLVAMRAE
jgi:putative ABC transport system permease protein